MSGSGALSGVTRGLAFMGGVWTGIALKDAVNINWEKPREDRERNERHRWEQEDREKGNLNERQVIDKWLFHFPSLFSVSFSGPDPGKPFPSSSLRRASAPADQRRRRLLRRTLPQILPRAKDAALGGGAHSKGKTGALQ